MDQVYMNTMPTGFLFIKLFIKKWRGTQQFLVLFEIMQKITQFNILVAICLYVEVNNIV